MIESRFGQGIRTAIAASVLAMAGIGEVLAAAPDAIVRDTTNEVLKTIASSPDAQKLRALADEKIVPHFDFRRMTQLAAGRVWKLATPQQQDQLAAEFQQLLVRTYTQALAASNQSGVKVAVRSAVPAAGGDETTVRTTVSKPGGQPIGIDYRMMNENGDWKVIDVVVENVSLVTNYRDWFASQAASGGIDSIIHQLQVKNQRTAA